MIPYCALFFIILLGAFVEDTAGNYQINNGITYNNPYYYPYPYSNVYNEFRPYPYWPVPVQQIPNQYFAPPFYRPFYVKCGIVSHLYACCLLNTRYRCKPLQQIYPAVKEPEDYDSDTEDENSSGEGESISTTTGFPEPAKRAAFADDFEFTTK